MPGVGRTYCVLSLQMRVFMSAFGVSPDDADTTAAERLSRLVRAITRGEQISDSPRLQCVVLAFDSRYDKDGTRRLDKTAIYVPNEYVCAMQVA